MGTTTTGRGRATVRRPATGWGRSTDGQGRWSGRLPADVRARATARGRATARIDVCGRGRTPTGRGTWVLGLGRPTGRRGRWSAGRGRHGRVAGVEHFVDRVFRDIEHGRFERSLSGLTAVSAALTTAEIYFEHYKASFGNKWMWSPILVTPPVVAAGIAGVFSKRWAKTALPVTAGIYTLNGLLGEYFHARGVQRRPGGWSLPTYNVPMGPPIAAPGLMAIVGGMGLLAAVLRREK